MCLIKMELALVVRAQKLVEDLAHVRVIRRICLLEKMDVVLVVVKEGVAAVGVIDN